MLSLPPHPELIAQIDRLILDQGRLDPLWLLVALGLWSAAEQDDWLAGRPPSLLARISGGDAGSVSLLIDLLSQAAAHGQGQGLVAGPGAAIHVTAAHAPHALGATGRSADRLAGLLGAVWCPAADRRQPDLFQDHPETALTHTLASAVSGQHLDAAQAALALLARACPGAPQVSQWSSLVDALRALASPPPAPCAADARAALRETQAQVQLAQRLLGRAGDRVVAALWAHLATALTGLALDPADPELHASRAWARAGRWHQARAALEAEAGWQGNPDLVAWHAHCCWQAGDPPAARQDWADLCWHHEALARRVLDTRDLPDRDLAAAWQRFGDLDEALPTPLFPAWLWLDQPALARDMAAGALPLGEGGEAFRRLGAMRSGDDGISQRKALALLNPQLLALYLRRAANPAG